MAISSVTGTWEIGVNWPYPKLFFTDYYIMAVAMKGVNLALYDLTNSGNVWTATERFEFSAASGITSIDIAGFNTYAVIVVDKGATKEVYEKNYSTKAVTLTSVATIPGANSCCNHNGRLVLGGLYSTGAPWSGLTACSVAWSDIGSNIMLPGNADGTSDLTAGYAKMPWDENGNGEVFKVLPLGNKIMVYGDKGIASMKQTIIAKYPAMETVPLGTVGVISNYAVAGNNLTHGFVDRNREWNIVTDEGIKKLDYYKYISQLTGEIIVSYEESKRRFYISDGIKCYVYNGVGMYSTHQCVSSIGRYKNTLMGFVLHGTDSKIRLETTPFDAGIQDMKTIESVETGLIYDELMTGKLTTRYDYKGDFTTASYTPLNDRGIFTQKTTGREFKLYLESDYVTGTEFLLSNILTKVKFSDKRNTRGRINAR